MRGGGRIVGLAMMIGGMVVLLGFLVWGFTALGSDVSAQGLSIGFFLALLIIAPLIGVGFYLFRKGQQEQSDFVQAGKEKKILNMVLTQGQVTIQEMMVALSEPREVIEDAIRHVVGKQLFSGAINWDKGVLYSVESQQLTDGRKCPNCGGELEFAGKGLIRCPWCGSEVFLTKRAAASTATPA